MPYAIGEYVQYKHVRGFIRFICDQCLTIMINQPDHKSKECRVVVWPSDYHRITRML